MTTPRQSYNPYQLIEDVTALLQDRGLSPDRQTGSAGEALAGAGQLLRALGVQPLLDATDSFARSNSRVWSEEDGLR